MSPTASTTTGAAFVLDYGPDPMADAVIRSERSGIIWTGSPHDAQAVWRALTTAIDDALLGADLDAPDPWDDDDF